MDDLCKLAFLTSEFLSSKIDENTAVLLSTKSSSINSDKTHQESLNEGFTSPAIFVYTLPNIMVGELSIRHQLNTENSCFLFNTFNAEFHHNYANILLSDTDISKVLSGWVNIEDEKLEALIYIVESEGDTEHYSENIKNLFKTI